MLNPTNYTKVHKQKQISYLLKIPDNTSITLPQSRNPMIKPFLLSKTLKKGDEINE